MTTSRVALVVHGIVLLSLNEYVGGVALIYYHVMAIFTLLL